MGTIWQLPRADLISLKQEMALELNKLMDPFPIRIRTYRLIQMSQTENIYRQDNNRLGNLNQIPCSLTML
jgi:hypothetical protein